MKKPDPRTCFLKGLYLARTQADLRSLEALVKNPAPVPISKLLGKATDAMMYALLSKDNRSISAVSGVKKAIVRGNAREAVKKIAKAGRRISLQISRAERACR